MPRHIHPPRMLFSSWSGSWRVAVCASGAGPVRRASNRESAASSERTADLVRARSTSWVTGVAVLTFSLRSSRFQRDVRHPDRRLTRPETRERSRPACTHHWRSGRRDRSGRLSYCTAARRVRHAGRSRGFLVLAGALQVGCSRSEMNTAHHQAPPEPTSACSQRPQGRRQPRLSPCVASGLAMHTPQANRSASSSTIHRGFSPR
jgi:hypothetical protein